MTVTRFFSAAVAATLLATSAFAGEIMIKDPYVRSSTPTSQTGAAFMTVMNHTDSDDRLIAATSDVAGRVELHTHIEDANGVMKMTEIEGGIPIAAGEMHMLKRGGDHVMFMGLTGPLEQGSEIAVTLTFEKAGDVQVQIPVDHERKPDHGAMSH
ncbi:MAG: copper chaperone PCu(A)C [Sulfitobacter sp.]